MTVIKQYDSGTSQWIPIVSGTPGANGATGATGAEGGTTTLTTKGDILTRGASAVARIGVGADGTFLKANSSATTGLEWGSIPSVSILDDVGDVVITSASSGQFLKWDGTNWVNATIIGGATVSDTPPSSPTSGQLWYESDSGKTFVYYDSFWIEVGGAAAYDQIIGSVQAKGDLLAGTASQALGRLGVGTNTQRLIANSSTSTGLAWANDTTNTVIDAKGDLLVGAATDVMAKLPVGTDNQVLVADSTATNGVAWKSNPWNTSWGVVARVQRATSTNGIGTTETVDLTTPSFTAVTGRLYKLTYFFPGYYSVIGNTEMYVRIRTTNTSGTLLASCTMRAETALTSSGSLIGYTTLTGGSYTLVSTVAAMSNTLTITGGTNFNAFLLVEDIGPA